MGDIMKQKHIIWGLVATIAMIGCKKEQPYSIVEKLPHQEPTIKFEATFDPSYEFDDEEARAARFSGTEVPRIILDNNDFARSANSTDRTTTSLRLGLFAYNANNKITNHNSKGMMLNATNGASNNQYVRPVKIDVKQINNTYALSFEFRWKDMTEIAPQANAAWFGQLHIGGAPGYDNGSTTTGWNYLKQYFSRDIPNIRQSANKLTEPNDEIREVLPDQPIQRRHFPMIGELAPLKLFQNNDLPASPGRYNDKGDNQGILGDRQTPSHKVVIRPRGTVIVIKLSNETGRDIDVVNLQTPMGKGFDFEGYYDGNRCRPFRAGIDGTDLHLKGVEEVRGMIDPQGVISPFVRYNSYGNITHRTFTLQSDRPQNANPLAVGAKSPGVFMLWVNPTEPNRALRLRVNYYDTVRNTWHNSLTQDVTPPSGGFAEGKAYRVTLPIKIDPADAPQP